MYRMKGLVRRNFVYRSSEVEEEEWQGDEGMERRERKMIKRCRNFPRLKMKMLLIGNMKAVYIKACKGFLNTVFFSRGCTFPLMLA